MKEQILIAGGSGLIGKRIIEFLDKSKYDIRLLSRSKRDFDGVKSYQWDLKKAQIDLEAVKAVDYCINLTGAGIADKRWSKQRKELIISSRVDSNKLLSEAFEQTGTKGKAYVSASAIGIYGDRNNEILREDATAGTEGFLAECTKAWEDSIEMMVPYFERTSIIRVGLVLSTKGGALEKMLMPAKMGSAAYFGHGNQYFSWIHIDDIARVFTTAMKDQAMKGVYNGVANQSMPVKQFVEAIKAALSNWSLVHSVPQFVLKLMLGEMTEMLMNSTRVEPQRLLKHGFEFEFTDAEQAIRDLIQRKL